MKKIYLLFAIVLLQSYINNSNAQLTKADDFTLIDTKNDTFNLYNLLEKKYFVLLDFGTNKCPSCKASAPKLKKLWYKYNSGKGNLFIFYLNIDGKESSGFLRNYVNQEQIPYPVFANDSNKHQPAFMYYKYITSNTIPQFLLISPDKSIIYRYSYSLTNDGKNYLEYLIDSVIMYSNSYELSINKTYDISKEFNVYPNPFKNLINIEMENNNTSDYKINIFDYNGKEIKLQENNLFSHVGNLKQINTETLPIGVYLLVVSSKGQSHYSKIVKM